MKYVADYFAFKEETVFFNKNFQKTVYIASDDSTVFVNLTQQYPAYTFIFNEYNRSQSSEDLLNALVDIFSLSNCEYLVCTFSSNLCRLVYELMQTKYESDASWHAISLDDKYYFSSSKYQLALREHYPLNAWEIELQVNDIIIFSKLFGVNFQVNTSLLNGYSYGTNNRTKKTVFFPLYKVKDLAV